MENYKTQKKINGRWTEINSDFSIKTNRECIYDFLMHDLIAKKLEHCTYITRIQRIQKYNGYIEIIVTYEGNLRRIYTIKSH